MLVLEFRLRFELSGAKAADLTLYNQAAILVFRSIQGANASRLNALA